MSKYIILNKHGNRRDFIEQVSGKETAARACKRWTEQYKRYDGSEIAVWDVRNSRYISYEELEFRGVKYWGGGAWFAAYMTTLLVVGTANLALGYVDDSSFFRGIAFALSAYLFFSMGQSMNQSEHNRRNRKSL